MIYSNVEFVGPEALKLESDESIGGKISELNKTLAPLWIKAGKLHKKKDRVGADKIHLQIQQIWKNGGGHEMTAETDRRAANCFIYEQITSINTLQYEIDQHKESFDSEEFLDGIKDTFWDLIYCSLVDDGFHPYYASQACQTAPKNIWEMKEGEWQGMTPLVEKCKIEAQKLEKLDNETREFHSRRIEELKSKVTK